MYFLNYLSNWLHKELNCPEVAMALVGFDDMGEIMDSEFVKGIIER